MTTMTPKMRRAHEIFASIGWDDKTPQDELDDISADLWSWITILADPTTYDGEKIPTEEIVRELKKIAARLDDFDLTAERVA